MRLRDVLTSLAVSMTSHQGFLPAWKPMSMCVINHPIAQFYLDLVSQSPAMGGSHPHSSVNAFLTRLSSLLHRFRPDNGESTELPQPSRHSAFHMHALLARLSSLIHSSPSENDAPDELQQPSRVDPRVLLARISSFLHRSRLNTDEEAEPHHTTPSSSRSDVLISRLSSLFRSQPHNTEEIELTQRPSGPRVVEVAAVRDKKVCLSSICLHSLWL
jgi:hypothetical protein